MESNGKAQTYLRQNGYIHNIPLKEPWNLVVYPGDYKYSSAKFYETGADDPIAIGFGLLTHYKE